MTSDIVVAAGQVVQFDGQDCVLAEFWAEDASLALESTALIGAVTPGTSYTDAQERLGVLKGLAKQVEEGRLAVTRQLDAKKKEIMTWADGKTLEVRNEINRLEPLLADCAQVIKAQQLAAQRKAQLEAEEVERQRQKAIAEERNRIAEFERKERAKIEAECKQSVPPGMTPKKLEALKTENLARLDQVVQAQSIEAIAAINEKSHEAQGEITKQVAALPQAKGSKDDWEIMVHNILLLHAHCPDCVLLEPIIGNIKYRLNKGEDLSRFGVVAKPVVKVSTRASRGQGVLSV